MCIGALSAFLYSCDLDGGVVLVARGQPMLGAEAVAQQEVQTISSSLFSESRSKFKDVVDNATVLSGSGKYRITCTSPIGGRGQDYR